MATSQITNQPILPAEEPLSDAEWNFLSESPPKFFPENQDSNWGLKRKIFCMEIQKAQDQLALIYTERFAQTSSVYLDEWEYEVGLPMNPTGKTLDQRRDMVLARLRKGPFTRTLRKNIVESYLFALAYGEPIKLFPPGVELVPSPTGVPIYGEPGLVKDMYRIYEDVPRFRYNVAIDSDFTPDVFAMTRDLKHFTPAGITIVVTTGKPSPLSYEWETYDMIEPLGFWMLTETSGTTATDSAYSGLNGTYTGSYSLNNTALLVNDGTRKSVALTGGYITIPDNNKIDLGDNWSVGLWFKRVTVDGAIQYLISKGAGAYGVWIGADNQIKMGAAGGTIVATSTIAISDTTTNHYLVCQKQGSSVKIYIDGVDQTGTGTAVTTTDNSAALNIGANGGATTFKGVVGYVVLDNLFLTSAQVQQRYNTGRDILTEGGD